MGNTQSLALYRENRGGSSPPSEPLFRIQGLDVSVTLAGGDHQFPYRPGTRVDVKVYNPVEERDVDGDWRAWRFDFLVTSHQIIDSDIYIIGYARRDSGFGGDVDGYICEDGHLPWEHDGACIAIKHYHYEGLVEMRLYFGKEELEPRWEFFDSLEPLNGSKDS